MLKNLEQSKASEILIILKCTIKEPSVKTWVGMICGRRDREGN
jgi:hypothetical protein